MSVSVCLVWPRCVYANTFSILVFIPVTTEVDKRFSASKCFYRCTASLEAVRHSYRRRRYDRPFVHVLVKAVIIANSSVTVTAGKRRFSQRYRLSSWLLCCQGQPILQGRSNREDEYFYAEWDKRIHHIFGDIYTTAPRNWNLTAFYYT